MLRDRLFSTAPILKKTDFRWSKNEVCFIVLEEIFFLIISLGKIEMINYCIVGDFWFQSYTVKHQSNGGSLHANYFTILSERTLLIQKFVKYLREACIEKEFIFFIY